MKIDIGNPRIAAVLGSIRALDSALIDDDHAIFAAMLAEDLVVNNPQNTLSIAGATASANASGRISYVAYDRTIEYAEMRGDMVVVLGEENCIPKSPNPLAGTWVRRRFLDLWKEQDGRWLLTARQATIIPPVGS